jgi:DNA-directed RNA polymerase subunit M/transcription elongation factor TFIIS
MATVAPQRIVIRGLFEEVLNEYPRWANLPKETRDTFIRRMERSCFEVTINTCITDGIDRLFTDKKFVERYSTTYYNLLQNLDVKSVGSYLVDGIIDGKFDAYTVADLTNEQMCPSASADLRAEIELRQKQQTKGKVSRAYTCRKCGCNETVYIEFQGRAADEASSLSIKCISCENVWRR